MFKYHRHKFAKTKYFRYLHLWWWWLWRMLWVPISVYIWRMLLTYTYWRTKFVSNLETDIYIVYIYIYMIMTNMKKSQIEFICENKIGWSNQYSGTLISLVSFTSELAFCIHNFRKKKQCQKKSKPLLFTSFQHSFPSPIEGF